VIVPQQMAWVVERFGKFDRVLDPGISFLLPFVQRIQYVFSLKEDAISVPSQTAITRDNVSISIDGVLYVKVVDAYKASYGVEDPHFAITQLAQTTMRSEIGKLTLDNIFSERENLNVNIVHSINAAAEDWGISCMRYEIRDITPPRGVRAAMEMQAEAERRKRALILDSEGEQEAEVNIANGKKMSRVLASEAMMQERINIGKGDAAALEAHASASANSTRVLAAALEARSGEAATSLRLAEQYVGAFKSIAQAGNTVVVPANAGDVGSMVAQAVAIFKGLDAKPRGGRAGGATAAELDVGEVDRADAPLLSTSALDADASEAPEPSAEGLALDGSREGAPVAPKPH
jgi:regulator of protease activity HflC (stomatin/prohibitin superfamily)